MMKAWLEQQTLTQLIQMNLAPVSSERHEKHHFHH